MEQAAERQEQIKRMWFEVARAWEGDGSVSSGRSKVWWWRALCEGA